ncbi:L,D-transpeptidase [Aliihoeflea sp. PC F10.4]
MIEPVSRRRFLGVAAAGAASVALSACTSVPRRDTIGGSSPTTTSFAPMPPEPDYSMAYYQQAYATVFDEGYQIPAVPVERINPRLLRRSVPDPTGEAPGTVVVDVGNHYLYVVEGGGRAMRYGVGLGRAGFEWSGRGEIDWKQTWPRWFPPNEMIDRQPELEPYRAEYNASTRSWDGGMQPGLGNPLGARALYIYQDGKDTLYRLHGSPEWWSIGLSVSSGCVRLINQDVMDLYERVPAKSPILVTSGLATV